MTQPHDGSWLPGGVRLSSLSSPNVELIWFKPFSAVKGSPCLRCTSWIHSEEASGKMDNSGGTWTASFLETTIANCWWWCQLLKKHFWDATNRLKTVFPVQHGGEKNTRSCQSKWTSVSSLISMRSRLADQLLQLKEDYLLVAILKTNSGFDWNNDTGTKFAKDDTTWTDFAVVS